MKKEYKKRMIIYIYVCVCVCVCVCVYIYKAASFYFTPEANTALWINYTPINFYFKDKLKK